MANYQPIIGLEIHVHLRTRTKMFCGSLNDPDEKHPNINVCPICLGHPGTLPVPNKQAIEYVIKTGLALGSQIAEISKFDRKNYFYPDLPKGYQISQYDMPFCVGGEITLEKSETNPNFQNANTGKSQITNHKSQTNSNLQNPKTIRIRRIHLEEDAGKIIHLVGPAKLSGDLSPQEMIEAMQKTETVKKVSLIDFNRAGVPLMELVTEPDLSSGEEARRFCEELQLILRYLGVATADMEKGEMRCEVNLSLRPGFDGELSRTAQGERTSLGTKVEVKNLNSFRAVERAINYEIVRQDKLLERGEKVVQETRGWDEGKGVTVSQRTKEEAEDYRYFSEPDIPPLRLDKSKGGAFDLAEMRRHLPELPQAKRERFSREYGLPVRDVDVLVRNRALGDFFERAASELGAWKEAKGQPGVSPIKLAANYLITDLVRTLREEGVEPEAMRLTPENFAEFTTFVHGGVISSSAAKLVLARMVKTGEDPTAIVGAEGLEQVSDADALREVVRQVVAANPKPVADYAAGKREALQALVGLVMKETKGRANPAVAARLIEELLAA
ncbi:Asp-tRNA(Asn)/Glu-tRNA(Gln) amidotransferase subunit GatB [Candidatus Parcubacteria bacterium]|nr:Asp-tRNA(Asn)/Glu-tRNA(Gln) amidotransferase subunit GatB [Candidatus Parcubacteria bacterium]